MKALKLIVGLVILIGLGLGLVGYQLLDEFLRTPLKLPAEGRVIQIKEGSNFKQLALRFGDDGLFQLPIDGLELFNPGLVLYGYTRLNKQIGHIKSGEYLLPSGITPIEILDWLQKATAVQYRVTFIEGWTFKEVLAALRTQEALDHQLQGLDADQVMDKLGYSGQHPEGRFFPDSYDFTRGTTDMSILQRAWKKMDAALAQAWGRRAMDISIKTPYEALIMASIVEKETGLGSERPEISGVFDRRLKKKMRLQTDPTVIYGMGDAYQGNIRKQDLQTDTPYNSYTRHGLPPTPICMPGQAALDAAVRPLAGESLYFVAKGDGSHLFSKDYKDHQKAVRQYQLKKTP